MCAFFGGCLDMLGDICCSRALVATIVLLLKQVIRCILYRFAGTSLVMVAVWFEFSLELDS